MRHWGKHTAGPIGWRGFRCAGSDRHEGWKTPETQRIGESTQRVHKTLYVDTLFMCIFMFILVNVWHGVSADRKVKAWQQKRSLDKVLRGKVSHEPQRWEEDYQLVECEGLFEEYLEMGEYTNI